MPVFVEFLLIAIALYLWESTLWLPLRSVALRKRRSGRGWKALSPGSLMATRELGLVPMLPMPPDGGLAPCQAPPLLVDAAGTFFVEAGSGQVSALKPITWSDLRDDGHHLLAGDFRIRISSGRCLGVLRRARHRGATPEAAVRQAWRLAISPSRAAREWRRWGLASAPLRWYGPLLTLGFFLGLPLVYIYRGSLPAVFFGLWLWCLMAWTAAHLWWLGKRVYPEVRSALRMDALLALLVPFHAMRALEIASVHALGTTHPLGLLLSSQDWENPWLGGFIRRILHPLPGIAGDLGFSSALRERLAEALSRFGKSPEDFDGAPDRRNDPAATGYCPRCHGLYLEGVDACPDCRGLPLRRFS